MSAERRQQFNIRAGNTKLRLKDVQEEEDTRSTGSIEKETEEQLDNEIDNLSETDREDTEHMKALNKIIRYKNIIGYLFGMEMVFGFDCKQPKFLFACFVLFLSWVFVSYTVYIHYGTVRVLEPLCLYGLAISVS